MNAITCASGVGKLFNCSLGKTNAKIHSFLFSSISKCNQLNPKCFTQTAHYSSLSQALTTLRNGKIILCLGLKHSLKIKPNFGTVNVLDINRNVSHDVIIYSNKNDAFFKTLSYAGVFQMLLWGYLALFAVQDLRVAPVKDTSDLPLWKRLLYKEGQYKNAISILTLFVGFTILFITVSYPQRAIKSLWLLRGGKDVKITTFSWLGRENTFKRPIEHINCLEARTGSGLYVPLQIKDKYFYFLVDKKGQFHNTDLFDYLIALRRNIK